MTEDNDSIGNTSKRVDKNSSTGGGNNNMTTQQQQDTSLSPAMVVQQPITDSFSAQRVFKKSSPNNKLTLYLCSRDLVVTGGRIDRLQGVLLIDPEYIEDRKVYGQITLTFRYGREDEEVMGLKFCNEAIMCLAQLYPPSVLGSCQEMNTPLQEALLKRLGPNAYPFTMEITPLAPPSVQLVPAKEYRGAPIGTSYDVRAYVAERADEKLQKRSTVRMGLRVLQHAAIPPAPALYNPGTTGNVFYSNSDDKPASTTADQPNTKHILADQKIESNIDDIENSSSKESTIKRKKSSKKSKSHQASTITLHSCLTDTPTKHVDNMPTSTNQQLLKESNFNRNQTPTITEPTIKYEKQAQFRDVQSDIEKLNDSVPKPRGTIVKTFMMSEGQIELEGSLDKSIYSHGESVLVNIQVNNRSHKTVRRIKAFIVQHVDVCMFSNGKFKNVVANIDSKEGCPIQPNTTFTKTYALKPVRSSTKNWIALEDSYSKLGTSLASTVTPTSADGTPSERNVFAIYVSYYVKIKLIISVVTVTEVSLKLPFTLMHTCTDSIGVDLDVQQSLTANMLPPLNFEKENIASQKAADDT